MNENLKRLRIQSRVKQLKAMHSLMIEANDENIYMTWIMGWIPDEPTEEDFIDCAENDEWYNETFELFKKLINKKGYL